MWPVARLFQVFKNASPKAGNLEVVERTLEMDLPGGRAAAAGISASLQVELVSRIAPTARTDRGTAAAPRATPACR